MSDSKPTISVLIPVRNEAAHIDRCVDAVLAQTYPPELVQILVMDGGSTDDTPRRVERRAAAEPRLTLLANPRQDTSSALNIGLRASSGDLIAYVLGHSVVPPDYLERMARQLVDRDAWSVGGRYARTGTTPLQRAIAIATALPIGVGDSRHNYAAEPGWVESAFPGFWRREVFDRIGPFDPEMLVNEDNELSLRIRKAGGRIWYDPSVAVEYSPRATLGDLFRQYHGYGRGKVRVLRKHAGGLRWRHAVPATWLASVVGGGAVSVVVPAVRPWWAAGIGTYAAVIAAASIRARRRDTSWWLVATALATLHVAYGSGFWRGLLEWAFGRRRA